MRKLLFPFIFLFLSLHVKGASMCVTPTNDSIQKFQSRITISFNSICCGIDQEKHKKFLRFVKNYKPSVSYSTITWGKEGERDYCFKLTELSPPAQKKFLKKIKRLLGDSRLVTIQENISCPR